MNFSKNAKLGKLLSLILALSLVASLFTGCFGKDDEPEDPSSEPNIMLEPSDTNDTPETQTQPTETEPVVVNENMATVLSQLSIRSSPNTEATVIGTLYAGERVEIIRRETLIGVEWAYIIAPEAGWICMDFVEMDFEPDTPAEPDTSTPAGSTAPTEDNGDSTPVNTTNIKGVITGSGVNIRNDASTTSGKIVGSYNKGEVVTILEIKDGWGRTNKGWVKMDYVNTSGNANTNTNTDNNTTTTTNNGNGSTTVQFRGIVTAGDLNIRSSASTDSDRVGSYVYGDRVEILEKDGNWGRTNKGWISLSYIYQDGTSGTKTAKGVVTGNGLRIRSGPGTNYDVVGSYAEGDSVNILEQFTYDGTTWGCTREGWISMNYVSTDGSGTTSDDNSDSDDAVSGSITADGLRIRSGPGTDYETVGSVSNGDRVTITDQVEDGNGVTWGKISQGWISMDYVDLD